MQSAALQKQEEITDITAMRKLVSDLFEKSDHDVEKTIEMSLDWYASHPQNKRSLAEVLIFDEIRSLAYDAMRAVRGNYLSPPARPSDGTMSGLKLMARDYHDKLMEYPVFGGKSLGDCTKEELQQYADQMIATGRTTVQRGHWFAIIAKNLKEKEPVRKQLKEADLKRYLRQSENKE